MIEKETQAVGVKMTRLELHFFSNLLKHFPIPGDLNLKTIFVNELHSTSFKFSTFKQFSQSFEELTKFHLNNVSKSLAYWHILKLIVNELNEKMQKTKKNQLNLFYSSILDVVRQNKYNILKILVKLQVGLKQKDLNMALLHAVKAGMKILIETLFKFRYLLSTGEI